MGRRKKDLYSEDLLAGIEEQGAPTLTTEQGSDPEGAKDPRRLKDAQAAASGSNAKRRSYRQDALSIPFVYPLDPSLNIVCGIDEAGRGPLMGDVVAGCVVLDHAHMIKGIDDSKHLSEKRRDALALEIKERAAAYGIGRASPAEIDSLNILNATYLAMCRAYEAMMLKCDFALIDGNRIPKGLDVKSLAVVKGDARVREIGAASILAKTERDADLYRLDALFPEYGFAAHKGYPTAEHLKRLESLPVLDCYRFSFGPVKRIIEKRGLVVTDAHALISAADA